MRNFDFENGSTGGVINIKFIIKWRMNNIRFSKREKDTELYYITYSSVEKES